MCVRMHVNASSNLLVAACPGANLQPLALGSKDYKSSQVMRDDPLPFWGYP